MKMKNALAKLLSINPLFSLVLVIGYIAFIWYVTVTIWHNGHECFAIIFALSITVAVKYQSSGLIDELKRIKSDRLG